MKKLFALFLPLALSLSVLAGCSASSGSKATGNAAPPAAQSAAARDQAAAAGLGNEGAAKSTAAAQSQPPETDGRKVVKSAELVLQTEHYDQSAATLESLVSSFGGYIESSSVQGDGTGGGRRTASYTVRVPAGRLEEFLDGAGKIGAVVNRGIHGQDVTQSYFDSETRLKTLKAEQDRILELMQKAEKIDDVLAIEQRLTDVQNQIEQLTGQLKQWDSLVSLSTVTVTLNEVTVVTRPEASGLGGQIASMFRASVSAMGMCLRYLLLGLTAVLPFAAAALAVGAAAYFVRRKIRGKKN